MSHLRVGSSALGSLTSPTERQVLNGYVEWNSHGPAPGDCARARTPSAPMLVIDWLPGGALLSLRLDRPTLTAAEGIGFLTSSTTHS